MGDSAKLTAEDQARLLGEAWERVPDSDKLRARLIAYKSNGQFQTFQLGPHAPTLTHDDLDLIHKLWLQAVGTVGLDLHHRDIVRVALEELAEQMNGQEHDDALTRIRRRVSANADGRDPSSSPPST